ncbi:MAG: HIT family protein [Nanoarchaeota archaeon]|nr:HIT family protein [Nanoarchaeota archaeon]
MESCIFCKIIGGEVSSEKITETDNFLVFRDMNEKAPGHSLVVPKTHIKSFLEMDRELYGEFMEVTKAATEKIMKDYKHESFNLIINDGEAAGQVVSHLHLHIIPRNVGDGYKICP